MRRFAPCESTGKVVRPCHVAQCFPARRKVLACSSYPPGPSVTVGGMRSFFSRTLHRWWPVPCSNLASVSVLGHAAPRTTLDTVATGTLHARATSLVEVCSVSRSTARAKRCTTSWAGLVTCLSCGHAGYRARGDFGDSGTASDYAPGDTKTTANTPNRVRVCQN